MRRWSPPETESNQPEHDPPGSQLSEHMGSSGGRRPYRRPRLTDFGDVRDVTLGPTPGVTDSGGFGEAFPFGPGQGPNPRPPGRG